MGLPAELLVTVVEKSQHPLSAYIQLLSLCHDTRQALHGSLRKLSVDDLDPEYTAGQFTAPSTFITADALAALVGPCKGLLELSLSSQLPIYGCGGPTEAPAAPWVDEAFAGHSRLAVLQVPEAMASLPVMERIIRSLSGLRELTLATGARLPSEGLLAALPPALQHFHLSTEATLTPALMGALGRACPELQVLHIECNGASEEVDWPGCLPPTLQALIIPGVPGPTASLEAALGRLTSLKRVSLSGFVPSLRAVASGITQLTLASDELGPEDARRFCGLVSLEIPATPVLPLLLAASQATLESLFLDIEGGGDAAADEQLFASLEALPRLASLRLAWFGEARVQALLAHQRLLDRLEKLDVSWVRGEPVSAPIASRRLRRLQLRGAPGDDELAINCPALELLALPPVRPASAQGQRLAVACPRLRRLEGLGLQAMPDPCPAMPDLEAVAFRAQGADIDWLPRLWAAAPRLATLDMLPAADPDALARGLAGARALTHLVLSLDVYRLATDRPLVLRLPGQLERLKIFVETDIPEERAALAEVRVEAAGLRSLCIFRCPGARLVVRAPALGSLRLSAMPTLAAIDLPREAPLRTLAVQDCPALGAPALLGCLASARLWRAGLHITSAAAWPPLAEALGRAPRLAWLHLGCGFPLADLALACPALRRLSADLQCPEQLRSVSLECPLLEELAIPEMGDLAQFRLAGPCPALRRIAGLGESWVGRMAAQFPGVRIETPQV
ncbi:hypothetical protein PAPYR_2927 [Paratrimastix pyriformis]|uniref:Uncharacterized protein n=1 Tax=Paratrimastix pyriformis TaxID=342808 RepID=A0ABQ8UTK9_9EUKA|nr:hypothetical protein PAPYR_2927 [Paratrimastix pyriformis]